MRAAEQAQQDGIVRVRRQPERQNVIVEGIEGPKSEVRQAVPEDARWG